MKVLTLSRDVFFHHHPCWPQFLNGLSSWSNLNLTWQKLSLLKNQMTMLGLRNSVLPEVSPLQSHQLCSLSFLLAVVLQAEPIPLVISLKILFPWLKTRLVLFPQHFYDHFLLNARKRNCNWGLHVSQELSAVVAESLPPHHGRQELELRQVRKVIKW